MREIKIRIKDTKYKNTWVYFDMSKSEENPLFDKELPLDPETIGQFTGLLDKNGKEIYEGDILHVKAKNFDKDFGVITWHKDGYFYVDDSFGEFPRDRCKSIGDFMEDISREFCVEIYVNGNIHERPEVIKKEEK